MVIQCRDGAYYRNPSWMTDKFLVRVEDDGIFVLYPTRVKIQTVRRQGCKVGFFFKSFEHVCNQNAIFADRWRSMYAYTGIPRRRFPVPDVHEGKSTERFGEQGEPVHEWTK